MQLAKLSKIDLEQRDKPTHLWQSADAQGHRRLRRRLRRLPPRCIRRRRERCAASSSAYAAPLLPEHLLRRHPLRGRQEPAWGVRSIVGRRHATHATRRHADHHPAAAAAAAAWQRRAQPRVARHLEQSWERAVNVHLISSQRKLAIGISLESDFGRPHVGQVEVALRRRLQRLGSVARLGEDHRSAAQRVTARGIAEEAARHRTKGGEASDDVVGVTDGANPRRNTRRATALADGGAAGGAVPPEEGSLLLLLLLLLVRWRGHCGRCQANRSPPRGGRPLT